MTSSKGDVIWISADPGCGKSVLAKSLVDNELRSTSDHKVCYFFFKDNDLQDNLSNALCAILHQLFSLEPGLIHHAIPSYRRNSTKITVEIEEMWRIFMAATSDPQAPNVTCVFDALDECRMTDRKKLIKKLTQYYQVSNPARSVSAVPTRQHHLKFLVTSRPYDDIQAEFHLPSKQPTIRLRGEDENAQIHHEIDAVIKLRVDEISSKLELAPAVTKRLETQLLEMEHRTYLWLHLAIDGIYEDLRDSLRPDLQQIDKLPTTVEEAYEKILSRIKHKQKDTVKKILQIIVGARRPLTIAEMAVALGIAISSLPIKLEDRLPEDHLQRQIVHWCGLFVFINHGRLYLIHQTAKEFLLGEQGLSREDTSWKHSLDASGIESLMTYICVEYLLLPEVVRAGKYVAHGIKLLSLEIQYDDVLRALHDIEENADPIESFVLYTASFWASHVRNVNLFLDSRAAARVERLYTIEKMALDRWLKIFWAEHKKMGELPYEPSLLCISAINGHNWMIEKLLSNRTIDIDQVDSTEHTPLMWAAEFGHESTVEFLLNSRADIKFRNKYQMDAFQIAAREGHKNVVELLLDKGADIDFRDEEGINAFLISVWRAHIDVIKLLLNRGADINSRDKYGLSALLYASMYGHRDVVELLLNRGADINSRDRDGLRALYTHQRAAIEMSSSSCSTEELMPTPVFIVG